MVAKEGDELGIEPIRDRLETDEKVFRQLLGVTGIPKVYLRNSGPMASSQEYVDGYEMTPMYNYELDTNGKAKIIESPWEINNDEGVPSYSLLPPAVMVSMLKQISGVLGL